MIWYCEITHKGFPCKTSFLSASCLKCSTALSPSNKPLVMDDTQFDIQQSAWVFCSWEFLTRWLQDTTQTAPRFVYWIEHSVKTMFLAWQSQFPHHKVEVFPKTEPRFSFSCELMDYESVIAFVINACSFPACLWNVLVPRSILKWNIFVTATYFDGKNMLENYREIKIADVLPLGSQTIAKRNIWSLYWISLSRNVRALADVQQFNDQ